MTPAVGAGRRADEIRAAVDALVAVPLAAVGAGATARPVAGHVGVGPQRSGS